jgi:NhaP-type Na+/H+ or K+/H+ antiporter
MTMAAWAACIGALLVSMVLTNSVLARTPLSAAMLYLGLGALLGPGLAAVLHPDPLVHTRLLETMAEVSLLVSLFAVGLQLGVPLRDRRWQVPLRLASVSMLAMVAMVTAVGFWALDLPLGAAIVLGGILAPTDPVLATSLPSEPGRPDRFGFSLAAEGGLNDGTAFPFVMLGLGILGLHDLGPGLARWLAVDLVWSTLGGLAIGGLLGAATGELVVYLRSRHAEAMGLDEFLSLGLLCLAFGLAQLAWASGFLSVFAAGLALQRVREQPGVDTLPLGPAATSAGHSYDILASHPHHASATMRDSVQAFNEQLEKLAELIVVLVVGAMLSYSAPPLAVWWFVPLVLLVMRPLSAALAFPGEGLERAQVRMIGWFGIRGIGSVFYLLLALRHGVSGTTAQVLVSLTLCTVAASIVLHGASGQPLMQRYLRRRTSPQREHATAEADRHSDSATTNRPPASSTTS